MGKVAVAVIVSLWIISVSILVNRIVPEPYMAQQYCIGNFRNWDPMITTPPGLWGRVFLWFYSLGAALSFSEVCTTAFLRTVNGVLAVLCSIIVYEIITFLRPTLSERKATIFAVVLALYPLHWFFTFPYYTDVASLTAVLAMYLACLKKSYWCIAVLGALAVVIRQTNDNVTSNSNLRRRKLSDALGLLDEVEVILLALWHRKWELLVFFSPFVMIMYFGLVSALAVAPLHCSIGQIMDMFQSFWKRRPTSFFQMLIAVIAGFFSVHFYSIAHPYLIADNRHYPFSLWRKVINVHWSMKYLLVPLYVYSWFFILSTLVYDYQSWLLMGLIYLALNVFTMTIFLFRPFHWDHEAGIQRFIW
ncbi:hypothetical protein ACJW30_07G065800 [Castanea mollissima]